MGGESQHSNLGFILLMTTGLHVDLTPDLVVDGERAVLTCGSCFMSENPTHNWYRDKQPLTYTNKVNVMANYLELDPVGREDAGSYSCAVSGREDSPGPAVILVVGWLHVDLTPDLVVDGERAVLTCGSCFMSENPTYNWYRDTTFDLYQQGQGYGQLPGTRLLCGERQRGFPWSGSDQQ
ncbi:junctional adhesion molecule A-like [Salvelinus alpinus]